MKLNIRSHDTGAKSLDELMLKLKTYSLDGVQLVPYKIFEEFEYNPQSVTKEKARKIREKLGGKIPLIGAYFNPVHSDLEKRERCKGVFCSYLASCADFGANTVGSETGSYNDDKWTFNPKNRTPQAQEIVTKTFRQLCDYAKQFGANVGIEGARAHVCYDVKTLNNVVQNIKSDNLKIILDVYNFLDETNFTTYISILEQALETFGKDICVYHLKDFIFDGKQLRQVPVGKGVMDYKKVLSLIKQNDKNAQLVLEGTTGAFIKQSAKLIRTIWGSV